MNLFAKLKTVFDKIDLKLSLFSNNKYEKTENHYHNHYHQLELDGTYSGTAKVTGDKITINPNNIPQEAKKELQAVIRDNIFLECDYILAAKDSATKGAAEEIIAKEISKYKPLEGVIPRDDFYALKAALVVNELHNQGKPIEEFRDNIYNTYGERGRKICTIYSAGYFNDILESYLKNCQSSSFSKEEFLQRYNIMVTESAFSVFVHSLMSKEVTIKATLDKLATNKRYGIYHVKIHAIGKQNISNTEQAVTNILSENITIEETERNKSGGTLFVKLSDTANPLIQTQP